MSSMMIMETGNNYQTITKALTIFDACTAGSTWIPCAEEGGKYGKTVSMLIKGKIREKKAGIDQYILNTFQSFINNKKEININIEGIMENIKDKELLNNILVKTEEEEVSKWVYGSTEFILREETDKTNLLHPQLIKLFTNAKEISMTMNQSWPDHKNIYTFSLLGLLSIIQGTRIKKVTMSIDWRKEYGVSWFKAVWNSVSEEMMKKYHEKEFDIKYQQDYDNWSEYIIIIKE